MKDLTLACLLDPLETLTIGYRVNKVVWLFQDCSDCDPSPDVATVLPLIAVKELLNCMRTKHDRGWESLVFAAAFPSPLEYVQDNNGYASMSCNAADTHVTVMLSPDSERQIIAFLSRVFHGLPRVSPLSPCFGL